MQYYVLYYAIVVCYWMLSVIEFCSKRHSLLSTICIMLKKNKCVLFQRFIKYWKIETKSMPHFPTCSILQSLSNALWVVSWILCANKYLTLIWAVEMADWEYFDCKFWSLLAPLVNGIRVLNKFSLKSTTFGSLSCINGYQFSRR